MIKNINSLIAHGNSKLRKYILEIANSTLKRINAYNILKEKIRVNGELEVDGEKIEIGKSRIFVVGFGKASIPMAKAIRDILGSRIKGGIINSPYPGEIENFKINVLPHPLPDERTVKASMEIIEFVKKLKENDLLIVLISGGASALFEVPQKGMSIWEERKIVERMLRKGANIFELNKVRIALSQVKGGKFLKYIKSRCISLIISDVIGPPQLVGSGPTYPQRYQIDNIVERYNLRLKKIEYENDVYGESCQNIVVADNTYALNMGEKIAEKMNLRAKTLPSFLHGEPKDIFKKILNSLNTSYDVFLFGGETWVNLRNSSGKGGRNQELALYIALEIPENTSFICLGTDGIDGPTDAAGGIVDDTTLARIKAQEINIKKELLNHNSYYVLKKLGDLIYTGYTGTNLADMCIGFRPINL